jgi:hypothetical protein
VAIILRKATFSWGEAFSGGLSKAECGVSSFAVFLGPLGLETLGIEFKVFDRVFLLLVGFLGAIAVQ